MSTHWGLEQVGEPADPTPIPIEEALPRVEMKPEPKSDEAPED